MIHHVTCTDPRLARSCNTPNLSVCNSYICNWQTKNSQRYSVQPSLKLLGCRVLSGSTLKSFLLVATNPLAMSFIGKTSSHVHATACSEPTMSNIWMPCSHNQSVLVLKLLLQQSLLHHHPLSLHWPPPVSALAPPCLADVLSNSAQADKTRRLKTLLWGPHPVCHTPLGLNSKNTTINFVLSCK